MQQAHLCYEQAEFYCENRQGILDRTHIHFFTLQEIIKMFMRCRYEIVETQGKRMDVVRSETDEEIYRQLMQIPGVASEINFQVYQYIVKAHIK